MNIHEHQAKKILKEFGAPVSNGVVILSVNEIKKEIKGSVNIRIKDLNKLNGQLFLNYRQVNQSKKWKRNKINYLKNSYIFTKFNSLSKQQYPIQYYFELIENKYSYFCPGINRNLSNQPYYIYDNK